MTKTGWLHTYLESVCSLDKRSLALFRILLGVFILLDLYVRWEDLALFYTDEGFLPAASLKTWSLYTWSGSVAWVQFLFLLTGMLSVLLVLGVRARWVMLALWVLTTSLHLRNGAVLNAGDNLLRVILLIGVFLPLNRCFSMAKSSRIRVFGEGTWNVSNPWSALYIFQIIIVYAISGYSKNDGIWSPISMGLHYVVYLHTYIKETALYLREYPELLTTLSYWTIFIERYLWLLVFVPIRFNLIRTLLVASYMSFHFGLFLFMELGMFPWLGMMIWVPFIPAGVWEYLQKRFSFLQSKRSVIGQSVSPFSKWVLSGAALFILALIIIANLVSADYLHKSTPVYQVMRKMKLNQDWSLFTGNMKTDGWLVMDAELLNGSHIDLMTGRQLTWETPQNYSGRFSNHRQRKFHRSIRKEYKSYMLAYMSWKGDLWNDTHTPSKKIKKLTLYYMKQRIRREGGYKPVIKMTLNELEAK